MTAKLLTTIPLVIAGGDGTTSTLKMLLPLEPEREAVFQDEVVVYADEQGTSNPKGGSDFAIGLEFGSTPVPTSVIQDALDQRNCDLGRNARCKDKRSQVRRTFFHATDDCDDCRGKIAAAIRDRLQERFFVSLRWHFPYARPSHPQGAELHQHLIAILLGLVASAATVRRIVFKFEGVQGMLVSALQKWLEEDIDVRIKVMLRQGILPIFTPIEVLEVGKSDHGVQVCDHLLWRENRQLRGKSELLEDVGMTFNHLQEHTTFKIALYQHGDVTLPLHDRLPDARDPGDVPWPRVAEMLYQIEASVHDLARLKPPELAHLGAIIADASGRTRGKQLISLDDFVKLHIAFLTVVRLYARQPEVTTEQRQHASDLARLSIIVVQQRETRAISMFASWKPMRAHLMTVDLSALR